MRRSPREDRERRQPRCSFWKPGVKGIASITVNGKPYEAKPFELPAAGGQVASNSSRTGKRRAAAGR